jgi:negative regulator of sigma E activity
MAVTEEMIMAYADGELDEAGRAEIEARMAEDADIARRVEAHRKLRASLAGVLGGVLTEPVPERLIAAAKRSPSASSAQVVDLATFRAKSEAPAKRAAPRWMQWGAIAATVVVGVMVGRIWLVAPPAAPVAVGPGGQMAAQGALSAALNEQLASNSPASVKAVVIGVSFRSNAGQYCRTFQVNQGQGLAGLACREPKGWAVRMAMASPAPTATTGYRTAASETPAPVLDAVQGLIAGAPLDAKAEAAAKAADWRP